MNTLWNLFRIKISELSVICDPFSKRIIISDQQRSEVTRSQHKGQRFAHEGLRKAKGLSMKIRMPFKIHDSLWTTVHLRPCELWFQPLYNDRFRIPTAIKLVYADQFKTYLKHKKASLASLPQIFLKIWQMIRSPCGWLALVQYARVSTIWQSLSSYYYFMWY